MRPPRRDEFQAKKVSNLSDIGFPVKGEEDVNQMLMDVLSGIEQVACPPFGFYYRFEDSSGAQIFLQVNPVQELMGFNPGFRGLATCRLELVRTIGRDTSDLDGAYVARPASGGGVFVFDLPDFKRVKIASLPIEAEVELSAFASNDLELFPAESAESGNNILEPLRDTEKALLAGDPESPPPQAHVRIDAEIGTAELRTNERTGKDFWAIAAKVPFGEISVVADPDLFEGEPEKSGRLRGSFWLSGKIAKV